jgi:hypothetical protein
MTVTKQSTDLAALMQSLADPGAVIDLFEDAAHLNLESPILKGATLYPEMPGRLVISGDLHDHRPNLVNLIKIAKLEESENNHLLLQEVIHGDQIVQGNDLSVFMLALVAGLKVKFPKQVHVLLSNHELAQIDGTTIIKHDVDVTTRFDETIDRVYRSDGDDIRQAMNHYVHSLPLALMTPNRILCCHTLPSFQEMVDFDPDILHRTPSSTDLAADGDAYKLVWSRDYDDRVGSNLCEAWNAKVIILGHEPAKNGYRRVGNKILILAADHDRGAALAVDLAGNYDLKTLIKQIIPIKSASR